MNTEFRRPDGTSFSCRIVGSDMAPAVLAAFRDSYLSSGDGKMSMADFDQLTREGHIINCAVFDEVFCFALFGLELMKDRDGPYTSFLYFDLWHGRLAPIAETVIAMTYAVTRAYADAEGSSAPLRCLLRGRDGWERMVRRLGIEMDHDGWIREEQQYPWLGGEHGFQ
jgi:hypothetical protein